MNKYKTPPDIRNTAVLKRDALARRLALCQAGLSTYTLGLRATRPAIVCLCCGLGSSHPEDIEKRYCGFCDAFHDVSPTPVYQVRDAAEIQRAHDILWAFNDNEMGLPLSPETQQSIHACLDFACWVLKHEYNPTFADNLATLEATAAQAGFVLHDAGRPIPPEES